jgi:hypothetical protein
MTYRFNFFLLTSIFASSLIFFSHFPSQAQASTLPSGWCQQPSSEQLSISERYSQSIGISEGGIRAVYQHYNSRIVLQRTDPRELVQVIEEGITLNSFEPLRYTANCRYLIATIRDTSGQYGVAVYDLTDLAATRTGTILNAGRNWQTVESSPEGTYLLVTAVDGLYLWNFTDNTQTFLTPLISSDCYFAGHKGCNGELRTYRAARWDVPHGLLQLDLVNDYTVTLTLSNATLINTEATPFRVHLQAPASQEQITAAAERFLSDYACVPHVQYQTYNLRLVLKDWLNGKLVAVVESNLDLSGFQFLGWSPSCTYIVAAIEDENGLRLASWNVNDMSRREHPLTDWVDNALWSSAGDIINVTTDGGRFTWNLTAS